jgi:heme/copper-type cytochrome/quinol oxidase subunit 2
MVLVISAAPALAITEAKARRRLRRGDPMPAWERLARVLALTILIPILVLVALGIAVFTVYYFLTPR